jgi:hypothetical protein
VEREVDDLPGGVDPEAAYAKARYDQGLKEAQRLIEEDARIGEGSNVYPDSEEGEAVE